MNKLGITVSAIALLSSATYTFAANQLETVLDLAFREMLSEGADISYDNRIIGDDGSVEYINLKIIDPDEEVTLTVDWIKGTPSASDPETVTFTMADTVSFAGSDEGENYNIDVRTMGMALTTNGILRDAMSTDDISVSFNADSFIVDGGDPSSAVLRKLFVDMGDVDFDLSVTDDESHVDGAFNASIVKMVYDFTADGDTQTADQTTDGMDVEFSMDIPASEDAAMGYLDGSLNARLKMAAGSTVSTSSVDSDGVAFDISGTSGASAFLLSISDGTVIYDVAGRDFDMMVTPGAGIPIPPVDIAMSEFLMNVIVPLNSADTPEEMAVKFILADLTVGEGLWSMIDPEKTISREPATLILDLEALLQIDALKAAMMDGDDPLEFTTLHSLDVNQILLSVGGAALKVDGAMTFNNDGPFPLPIGGVTVALDGIQTIANQLVALGLIDQMQAGMAMGMMMAFAIPGAEQDTFLSEITFSKDGSILANGQPIR